MIRLTYLSLLPPERDLRRHDPLALGDECALSAQTVPPPAIPLVALIYFYNNYIDVKQVLRGAIGAVLVY